MLRMFASFRQKKTVNKSLRDVDSGSAPIQFGPSLSSATGAVNNNTSFASLARSASCMSAGFDHLTGAGNASSTEPKAMDAAGSKAFKAIDSPPSPDDTFSDDSSTILCRAFTVTVTKMNPAEKLGIHVGVKAIGDRYTLVVTKKSLCGLLVKSPIEVGDIVAKINGVNYLDDPKTTTALGKY